MIDGASGVSACRTADLSHFLAAFTPLPDDPHYALLEPVDFGQSMEPLVSAAANHAMINSAVKSRAVALHFLDKMRREMACNASEMSLAFYWGLLSALRAAGHLTVEDVEAYRHRIRSCPGHAGASWCAYCGSICRVCGENDPCGMEECAAIRFGDGPRDKGFPPRPEPAEEEAA